MLQQGFRPKSSKHRKCLFSNGFRAFPEGALGKRPDLAQSLKFFSPPPASKNVYKNFYNNFYVKILSGKIFRPCPRAMPGPCSIPHPVQCVRRRCTVLKDQISPLLPFPQVCHFLRFAIFPLRGPCPDHARALVWSDASEGDEQS